MKFDEYDVKNIAKILAINSKMTTISNGKKESNKKTFDESENHQKNNFLYVMNEIYNKEKK